MPRYEPPTGTLDQHALDVPPLGVPGPVPCRAPMKGGHTRQPELFGKLVVAAVNDHVGKRVRSVFKSWWSRFDGLNIFQGIHTQFHHNLLVAWDISERSLEA